MYEDRQCRRAGNLVPTIVNTPLTLVNDVIGAVPTAVPVPSPVATLVGGVVPLPPISLPPIPQVPLTPEQAEALIPDDLLATDPGLRVRRRGRRCGARPAVPQQAPFTFRGKTTQYPQVDARSDG